MRIAYLGIAPGKWELHGIPKQNGKLPNFLFKYSHHGPMIRKFAYSLFLLMAVGMAPVFRHPSWAQGKDTQKETHRLLIILDTGPGGTAPKEKEDAGIREISRFIKALADSLYRHNAEVELALAGKNPHLRPPSPGKACTELSRLVPYSRDNRVQIGLRLDDIVGSRKPIQAWEVHSLPSLMSPDPRYHYRWIFLTLNPGDCLIPPSAREKAPPSRPEEPRLTIYFSAEGRDCPGEFFTPESAEHAQAISRIVQQFPKLVTPPELRFDGHAPRRIREPFSPRENHSSPPLIDLSSTDSPVPKNPAPPASEPEIRFTEGSKMRSSEPYGTIHFQISRPVPVIYLFRKQGGQFEPDQEVFTLGLNRLKVQLPPGTYRALYHPDGLGWNKEFEVKVGEVIGIWLR